MKKDITLMKLVFIALFVSSFSVILSIFVDYKGTAVQAILGYVGAVLFWIGLVIGYVILGMISKHRKDFERINKPIHRFKKSNKPGIIRFLSNKYAMIADVAMVVFLIVTLVFIFIPSLNQNVAVIFAACLIFSVHMHSILNGVNFTYIKSLRNKGE